MQGGPEKEDQDKVTFRCSDIHKNCAWEVSGNDEQEIMPKIKDHGRTKHAIESMDSEAEHKVRKAIHRRAA